MIALGMIVLDRGLRCHARGVAVHYTALSSVGRIGIGRKGMGGRIQSLSETANPSVEAKE